MQYLLLLRSDEVGWAKLDPETQNQWVGAYEAFAQALGDAGVFRGSNRLEPTSQGATVRVTDGKPQVLDGPFADSKEQLGGYFVIEVPDLDSAVAWATRCPGARHGLVEVRAVGEGPRGCSGVAP